MKAIAKRSRAISPLIATIILIAITVVGGLLVYSIFTSTSNTMSAKALVSVETVDLVKDTGGNANFSIVIKNTGNKPINTLKVQLASESEATVTLPGGKLQPGQSVAYSAPSLSGSYTVGNSYIVVIKATFEDGSTFVTTTGVMCRFA
jgi:flagellin-like protein